MTDCFVGRQPIFNGRDDVFAYELLYRSGLDDQPETVNPTVASTRLVIDAFVEIGIENIVGKQLAMLSVDGGFLSDSELMCVPPDQAVLMIPATTPVTAELESSIDKLKDDGYTLGLTGYRASLPAAELIDRFDVVSIDTEGVDDDTLRDELASLQARVTVANGVQSNEDRRRLAELGFDHFQGPFWTQPEPVSSERLPSNRMAVLQLVTKISDPELESDELADLIAMDASMTIRILRFVNSPLSGLTNEVDSIHQAVVLVGRERIKSWVMLLAIAGLDDTIPEVVTAAFTRAKLCELLATAAGIPERESYFTVGLFSLMDVLMTTSMQDLLATLPFSAEVKAALMDGSGPRGEAIRCVTYLEAGRLDKLGFRGVGASRVAALYLEATRWADQTVASTGSASRAGAPA